jgi:hypothetical protein
MDALKAVFKGRSVSVIFVVGNRGRRIASARLAEP